MTEKDIKAVWISQRRITQVEMEALEHELGYSIEFITLDIPWWITSNVEADFQENRRMLYCILDNLGVNDVITGEFPFSVMECLPRDITLWTPMNVDGKFIRWSFKEF